MYTCTDCISYMYTFLLYMYTFMYTCIKKCIQNLYMSGFYPLNRLVQK